MNPAPSGYLNIKVIQFIDLIKKEGAG